MNWEETELEGCYILTPKVFGDERGSFSVTFNALEMEKFNFQKNYQDNLSISQKGVLRGMHFQEMPDTQAKIVSVIKGAVIDVVVDLRIDSPSYGKYTSVLLTEENRKQLLVPRGFAHGYLCLVDGTKFVYKVGNIYSPKKDGGILWNDPTVGIPWEQWCAEYGIDYNEILLKEADMHRPLLKDCQAKFYMKYRYLVTGATGQLGYDVVRELHKRGIYDVLAFGSEEMDITNPKRVEEIMSVYQPEVIIHCAAYTNVKEAETEEGTKMAHRVNVQGSANLALAASVVNAKLIYISTDYVFDGKKGEPYETTDKTNPINAYGKSKFLGEEMVKNLCPKSFIVRTSWVFGINGNNFVKTMLQQAQTKDHVEVVNDQFGSPTYTVDLAKFLVDLSGTDYYGYYQAHNEGYCTWYDFTKYIYEMSGITTPVEAISTSKYPSSVERPMDSRMCMSAFSNNGFDLLPNWQDATKRYLKELKAEK